MGKNEDVGFLDERAGEGYEGVQTNIPRVKILHFTSPEVLPGDEHVEGAAAGHFFNTVTNRVYGPSVSLIPVRAMTVWLLWAPKESGGGFRGRVPVGSVAITGDLFAKAYTDDGNLVQEAVEIYALVEDAQEEGLVCLSLTGSSIKHAKAWLTRISTVKLPSGKIQPFFGSVWTLTTSLNKNTAGQWFTFGVKNATSAERVRFINGDEYKDHVKAAVEFADGLHKMLLLGRPAAEGQKLLEEPF